MLVTLDQLVFLEELGLLESEARLEQLDLLGKRVFLAPSEHQALQVIQVLPVPKE